MKRFRFFSFWWLFGILLAGSQACPRVWSSTTNSWPVFRLVSASEAVTGPNVVVNAGMESGGGISSMPSWSAFGSGYLASTGVARSGTRSLQCSSSSVGQVHGGYQTIVLNQTTNKALKLSGWSKAQGVTGSSNDDYSVYLDILYVDGTPFWGQTIRFSTGTHDWECQERFVIPTQPIKQINCYLLFRNTHTGTVWFDDITISEVQDPVIQFDGSLVSSSPPSPLPFNPVTRFTLSSGDGLQLQLAQEGGVIEGLRDGTNNLQAVDADYASGWFVCDQGEKSDWWNVGGSVIQTNGMLQQNGVIPALNLSAQVCYSVTNNAIRIQATVSNLISSDRAISLYFALPAAMDGGWWWNSPRDRVPLSQAAESATFCDVELGARNLLSRYPLATVAASGGALTLAVPPDQYRPFRLTYNRETRQFFVAFDLGISPIPTNFPQVATAEIWLYRSDPSWGMRSGLEGFYRRFPEAYARTFTNEGIWVAFADIHGITNISDFGIAYHEIGYDPALVKFDDTKGIQSFRYVSEPWSYWMEMTNGLNTDYFSVYNYLLSKIAQGDALATATLSSGSRDPEELLNFDQAARPWCLYGAVFYLNASPFISDPKYPLTKFAKEWNSPVRDVYNHPENGRLDGEYIDSFCAAATIADFSTNHMRTTSFPLAYTRNNRALMSPLILGTYEMARAISKDLHAMGKPIIANTVFVMWPGLPVGIGLFDFVGTEINCFDAGNFIPLSDSSLLYARALSGQRPYGYLLNTDFREVSREEMESYMRLCAVYAIYPSAFSADAATGNYFEQPALYERDRSLFKKYVPIIRAMSLTGWQPVTDATADTSAVGLESYGTNSFTATRYLTVRNFSSNPATARISFDLKNWASPSQKWLLLTNLFDGGSLSVNLTAGSNSVFMTLQGNECRAYSVQASPSPRPAILMNDGAFGLHLNQFGFDVSAFPGQEVVIEAGTNLLNLVPIHTNPVPNNGFFHFADPESRGFLRRFYRARSQ